jgi:hypothetical protein
MFVVRHQVSGAAHFIAQQVAPYISVINGGDGRHEHPTQGMLDAFTIRRHKQDFTRLKIAIVGDVAHSRVARSNIQALKILGVPDLRVVGPKTLIPPAIDAMGVTVYDDLDEGIRDCDVHLELLHALSAAPRTRRPAGIRTFALASLLGAVATHLGGMVLLAVALAGVIILTALSYL